MLKSIYSRTLALVLSLLLMLQAVGYGFISQAIQAYAKQRLDEELAVAGRVMQRQLDQNGLRLAQAARVLAADFGFREAVATADRETIQSALDNSGARISAELAVLADPSGKLLATSSNAEAAEVVRAVEGRPAPADASVDLQLIAGTPYQIVSVPVLAPQPIAIVRLGFRLGDALANDLRQITSTHVSLVALAAERTRVAASSLPTTARAALASRAGALPGEQLFTLDLDDEAFESLVLPLAQRGGGALVAVLQRSLAEAMQPFRRMQVGLFFLTLIGLAVAAAAGTVAARRIARPVGELAAAARRIEGGDYAADVVVHDRGEIGDLAHAFNHMRMAIGERERRISELAYRDPLTGLPNRLQLHETLTVKLRDTQQRGQPLCVLWVNLDRFSSVNEILGYLAGDEVLRAASARLSAIARGENGVAARHGGDEFVLVLPGADAARGTALAERLVREFELPVRIDETDLDVTVCIGVSHAPEHGKDAITLLRRAELALNRAKEGHARLRVFEPAFDRGSTERLTLLHELRRAVSGSELKLAYQPKIALEPPGKVVAAEALIRWLHPIRGWVQPGQFIPFAEQTGFIPRLTRWAVSAAVRQAAAWKESGIQPRLYVNTSAYDLAWAGFADFVRDELKRYGMSPDCLGLEVTESAFMDDPKGVMATLEQLHAAGVDLAIDDFGTGYSSLAYLRQLPVQELKIDRSFVKDMTQKKGDETIVRSTIDLGHNLGLALTAEGVEDRQTCELLRQLGCDYVQGFVFSRPLLPEEFETWWRTFAGSAPLAEALPRR
jgi:diguanylate cyclase (GGDEF)-like protein